MSKLISQSAMVSACIMLMFFGFLKFELPVVAEALPVVKTQEAPVIIVTPSILPVVEVGVPHEEAKRNALLFIAAMTLALGGLVAVGYWKQGSNPVEGNKEKKIASVASFVLGFLIINTVVLGNALQVRAFCPVCTVAVGAGLGVSKSLGIDDLLTSIWIGGLLVSMSMWTINWLTSKKIRFMFRQPLIWILMYAMVIVPLSWSKMIGTTNNTFWGYDKVLLGIFIGTIGFIIGYFLNLILLKKNEGKVYFPFQKVVLPLMTLNILCLIFYFLVYP